MGDAVIPPVYIRAAMQVKYPDANFGRYFAFLTSCPAQPTGRTHRHHIAPKEQFPEYRRDAANLIPLSVGKHAQAHKILAQCCSALDWIRPEFIAAASRSFELGLGCHAPGMAAKGGRAAGKSPKWQAKNSAAMRRRAHDQNWRAVMSVVSARNAYRGRRDEKWYAAQKQGTTTRKQLVLPEKKIVSWYLAGLSMCEIARRVGTGERPCGGRAPRIGRIRTVLIRAGVYVKPVRP